MKTIRTDEFLSEEVWQNLVEQCGENKEKLKDHLLIRFTNNTYSQWGEDGVLDRILVKLGSTSKVAVEFGAKNGVRISSTLLFRRKYGFRRILIEANPNIICESIGESLIHAFVTPSNINELLKEGNCPEEYDILSVDIDGDDYWVWKAMKPRARVVMIEYHAAIPNDIPLAILPGQGDVRSHTGEPILNGYYGANLLAFYDLAKAKGYQFCLTFKDNAFFVLEEEFKKLGIPEVSREDCVKNYFQPEKYWWKHRDKHNKEWLVV